jgi:hypothetical protein
VQNQKKKKEPFRHEEPKFLVAKKAEHELDRSLLHGRAQARSFFVAGIQAAVRIPTITGSKTLLKKTKKRNEGA